MKPDYSRIPEATMETIQAWIATGRPMGSFTTAVISNDLMEAYRRADDANIAAMFDIVCWLHNHAPISSYGSPQALTRWPEILAERVA